MPELDGIGVVRMLKKDAMPLVAFVTVVTSTPSGRSRSMRSTTCSNRSRKRDYAKPSIARRNGSNTRKSSAEQASRDRCGDRDLRDIGEAAVSPTDSDPAPGRGGDRACATGRGHRRRRGTPAHHDDSERATHDYLPLEGPGRRLDPSRFIRLGRGTLVNVDLIMKVNTMPGRDARGRLEHRTEAAGQPFPVARAT